MIKKDTSIGLAGGISLKNVNEIEQYSDFCKKSHLKLDSSLKFVDKYIGLKKELVKEGKDRNYLFHIEKMSPKIWSVVLGKFTLMFSLGPEFIRRVYNKNIDVNLVHKQSCDYSLHSNLSETDWQKIINKKEI